MKKQLIILFIILLPCVFVNKVCTQDFQEIKKMFPDDLGVYKSVSRHIKISLEKDELLVKSETAEEFVYATETITRYPSRSIYHSGFNQLESWLAYSKDIDGKKQKVTESKENSSTSESIFYDDVKETSFNFPSIGVGSIGHIEYITVHKDPRLMAPYYFDRYYPVINGELKISFPETVKVKWLLKGMHQEEVVFNEEIKKGKITYTFSVNNFKGEKSYADAPDHSYYETQVIFYIDKYQKEDGSWVNYLSNLDDLYKMNYGHIKDINKQISPELKNITDSLVKGITDEKEKAKRIYQWVQAHIKYIAFEEGMEGFIPREANLVCSRRFGDCKDMSSIITVMCRHAGLQAYYTWIGARNLPYDYSEIHLPIVDNHMISTVKINNEYIFLDGTDASCIFGFPADAIQNKEALIALNEKEYKIIRVPVMEKEKTAIIDTTFMELTDKGITGTIRMHLKGYFASRIMHILQLSNEDDRTKYFKSRLHRGSNKINLHDFAFEKSNDKNEAVVTARFELPDYAKKVSNEWYVNMNLFKFFEKGEIEIDKRKVPIENDFKYTTTYVAILKIPEGYMVSYLPTGKQFKNDLSCFEMNYQLTQNELRLSQYYENNLLLVNADKFPALNQLLAELLPLYKETVLISKK